MFGDVLVPLDGSETAERALEVALPICRYLDSTLRIVAYADEPYIRRTRADIDRALARLDTEGVTVRIVVSEPSMPVLDSLASALSDRPGTLLCMTTHGRGRSDLFAGGIANGLLHRTSTPVILVGPSCDASSFTIGSTLLVTTDGSPTGEAIVPVSIAWALVTECPVEVVTVTSPSVERVVVESHGDLIESSHVHAVADQMTKELGRPVSFEVLHAKKPARAILDHLASPPVGMVAMATHGTTGLARLAAGSVTADVIKKSPVPVLALRPPHLRA